MLLRAQRLAKRTRAAAACLPCKAKKARCSDYRPCARCKRNTTDACRDNEDEPLLDASPTGSVGAYSSASKDRRSTHAFQMTSCDAIGSIYLSSQSSSTAAVTVIAALCIIWPLKHVNEYSGSNLKYPLQMMLPSDENEPETLAPQAVSHHPGTLPESSWILLSTALAPSRPIAPLQHSSSPMSRGNEVTHSCSSSRFHAMSAAPREFIPFNDPALFLAGRRLCSPDNHTLIVAPQPPPQPLAASSRPQRRRRRRPSQRRDTLRFGAPAPRGCGSWPPVRAPTPSTTTGSTGAATGTAWAGTDGWGFISAIYGGLWPEGMARLGSVSAVRAGLRAALARGDVAPDEFRWAGPLRALFCWHSTAASPSINATSSSARGGQRCCACDGGGGASRPLRGEYVALARLLYGFGWVPASGRVTVSHGPSDAVPDALATAGPPDLRGSHYPAVRPAVARSSEL